MIILYEKKQFFVNVSHENVYMSLVIVQVDFGKHFFVVERNDVNQNILLNRILLFVLWN